MTRFGWLLLCTQVALSGGDVHKLLPWLASLGVDVGPVEVRDAGLGPGLFSTRRIEKGEVYLAVPYRLAMGPDRALRDPVLAPLLARSLAPAAIAPSSLGDCTLTVLQLLHESGKGAGSVWHAAIAAMPRAHLALSECEPSVWMPPGLRRCCAAELPPHRAEFERLDATPLLATLLQMPGAAFAPDRWRAFRWALGMALSRGQGPIFPNSTRSCWLTPGLDMHNHRLARGGGGGGGGGGDDDPVPVQPMSIEFVGAGLHAGIAVPHPIAAGVEIMQEYHGASKCQHQMLLAYGFIPAAEPQRECLPVPVRVPGGGGKQQVHFINAAGTAPPALLQQLVPGVAPGVQSLEAAPAIVVFSLLALLQKLLPQYAHGGARDSQSTPGASEQRAVRPPTRLANARCGGLTGAPTNCSTFQALWESEQRVLKAAIARVEARIETL
jgi:hypothetical protein